MRKHKFLLILTILIGLIDLQGQQNLEFFNNSIRTITVRSLDIKLPFFYEKQKINVEIINDYVVMEGDILLGKELDFFGEQAAAIEGKDFRWENGIIPFEIESDHPKKEEILMAIEHVKENTMICLVPRSDEKDFVEFIISNNGCASYVGKQSGKQEIFISPSCPFGSIVHEICHAAGLYHEQSRKDRDNYVTIKWENISSGRENNFQKYSKGQGIDLGEYDYGSLMHYPEWAFSKNDRNTINIKIPPGNSSTNIGQRNGLSNGDINGLNAIYHEAKGCSNSNQEIKFKSITAANDHNNIVHLFGIDEDNTLYLKWFSKEGKWSKWIPNWAGAPKLKSIVAANDHDNIVHLLGISEDNTLYLKWFSKEGKWSKWIPNWAGAPKLKSIAAANDHDNIVHLFGIDEDNTLYLKWFSKESKWSKWIPNWAGAPKLKSIVAANDHDNIVHLFGIDEDNTLYLKWFSKDGKWSKWVPNWDGAPKLKSIVAANDHDNIIHLLGIGEDHNLYLKWFSKEGKWSKWIPNWAGAPKLKSIVAANDHDNIVHLFGIDEDNTLCLKWFSKDGKWSKWIPNWDGAPKLKSIVAANDHNNIIHLLGIGEDHNLYLKWFSKDGKWSKWIPNWGF